MKSSWCVISLREAALCAVAASAGCSPTITSTTHEHRGDVERVVRRKHLPQFDRVVLEVHAHPRHLDIRVDRRSQCWVARETETTERITTTTEPSFAWIAVEGVLGAAGAALAVTHELTRDEDDGQAPTVVGAAVGVGFGGAALADLTKADTSVREERRRYPSAGIEGCQMKFAQTAGLQIAGLPVIRAILRDGRARLLLPTVDAAVDSDVEAELLIDDQPVQLLQLRLPKR